MRVAVTGATGFIGRHVVASLLSRGIDVVAAARNCRSHLPPHACLLSLDVDISRPREAVAALGHVDALIHLSWAGLPNYRERFHLEQELPKQLRFLSECHVAGIQRLVVAGTCLEYGMHSGCLTEASPADPVTCYGQAKHALHNALEALGGVNLLWLRLFYLFGDGQSQFSLFSQLKTAVESGAVQFEMSPGDQQRDFLPVAKGADYIAALSLSEAVGTVNICSGTPTSVKAIAQSWLGEWNSNLQLVAGVFPYPDYEAKAYWGCSNLLQRLLNNSPLNSQAS